MYKTSILVFKDRDRYVSGDWRWRNGYSKKNRGKMVQTWAEKEMRNLIRLKEAGLRVPAVEMLRSHVLVMEFIGSEDGVAAPRLRDADISDEEDAALFTELADKRSRHVPKVSTRARRSERVQPVVSRGAHLDNRRVAERGPGPSEVLGIFTKICST